MRVVLQRVSSASVSVNGAVVGEIGRGVLLLVGVAVGDSPAHSEWLANKIASLRIFPAPDGSSHFDQSLLDVGGAALVVSQFTLYGQTRKGRRPEFVQAARPEIAAPLIEDFIQRLRALGVPTQSGIFGADMKVALVNDGPVTLILDAPEG
ncbi:MAG: D-aminoacyl-tRNA deacylase [Thermoflexales bacterium]|nr:D-aminoacyl-tRNA deacylase [Thermoflexales bacterium]